MKDPELQINDDWSDDSTSSSRKRRTRTGSSKFLQALLVILLVLMITGGISYFLSKGPRGDRESTLQLKVTALEQKMANLQNQLTELQGKMSTLGTDPALHQRSARSIRQSRCTYQCQSRRSCTMAQAGRQARRCPLSPPPTPPPHSRCPKT